MEERFKLAADHAKVAFLEMHHQKNYFPPWYTSRFLACIKVKIFSAFQRGSRSDTSH